VETDEPSVPPSEYRTRVRRRAASPRTDLLSWGCPVLQRINTEDVSSYWFDDPRFDLWPCGRAPAVFRASAAADNREKTGFSLSWT
jgi:hypothetical protein